MNDDEQMEWNEWWWIERNEQWWREQNEWWWTEQNDWQKCHGKLKWILTVIIIKIDYGVEINYKNQNMNYKG